MTEDSVTVAEVSSFQLETIMDFRPNVGAILNITPDHLNRHGTMENYIRIKECITLNQTKEDAVVLNYDDPVLREFGQNRVKPRVIWFSSRGNVKGRFLHGRGITSCTARTAVRPLWSMFMTCSFWVGIIMRTPWRRQPLPWRWEFPCLILQGSLRVPSGGAQNRVRKGTHRSQIL